MSHHDELNLLIDQASGIAGGDSKLGRQMGVTAQRICDWRAARRTATPEDQALLAAIAGMDPVQVLARAMVQKHEGTKKGDQLMRALGKALLATGGAIGTAGASAAGTFSSTAATTKLVEWTMVALDTMYRKVKSKHRLRPIKFTTKALT